MQHRTRVLVLIDTNTNKTSQKQLVCLFVCTMVDSDSDDDVTATATILLEPPDPDEGAIEIKYGDESFTVTRKAKQSMTFAVEANSNPPTVLYRCLHAIQAVVAILGADILEYSMPQTQGELDAFDWNEVIPGRKETYPPSIDPLDSDFAKVKSVYTIVKDEKDTEARSKGLPKSGAQSYMTYKQRWRQWREICAVYRAMNPTMELQTVYDLIMGRLKLLKSLDAIFEAITEDLRKHVNKLKRAAKKTSEDKAFIEKMKKAKEEAEEAKEEAKEAAEREKAIQDQRTALLNAESIPGATTRDQTRSKRKFELKKVDKEQTAAQKVAAVAKAAAQESQKQVVELAKKHREAEEDATAATAEDTKRKLKRNDTARLDLELTPRQKCNMEGDGWKPPTRIDTQRIAYEEPGDDWKRDNTEKIHLLLACERALTSEEMLQPMTFLKVMEFMGADDGRNYDFNTRIFIFLCALILHECW